MAVILKWLIVLIALMNSGYMLYDGTRAVITGDYIRPKTGEYAGQLGPWNVLAGKIGIDPMSILMKSIFIFFGITGLLITVCFAMGLSWSWKALFIFNICSSWNLFFGTASSVLQIILLVILRLIA
jgi:hypothetical protein